MNLQDDELTVESWIAKAFSWSVAKVVAYPKTTVCIGAALLLLLIFH